MDYKEIPGLTYTSDAINQQVADTLLEYINSKHWQTSLKRQVQQYGTHYNYTTKSLGASTEIPKILLSLASALGLPKPENIIINKYEPGEGIAPHADSSIFGDTIASLSLMSGIPMDLQSGNNYHTIWLEPNSLLKLTGQSRYHWTHGICPRKSDVYNGRKIIRKTRISITFRTLASSKKPKPKPKPAEEDLADPDLADWTEVEKA